MFKSGVRKITGETPVMADVAVCMARSALRKATTESGIIGSGIKGHQ